MNYEDLKPGDHCVSSHGARFVVIQNDLKAGGRLEVLYEDNKPWFYGQVFVGSEVQMARVYAECVHRGTTGPNAGSAVFTTPCAQCEAERRFYIHESETNGLLALWWKPDRSGYTTVISQAGLYTKAEAEEIGRIRGTDLAIPREEVEALTRPVVFLETLRKGLRKGG